MKDPLQHWLEENAALPEIQAAALSDKAGSLRTLSRSPAFRAAISKHVWHCVAETIQLLKSSTLPRRRVRWVFQSARLLLAVRTDGLSLAVITRPDAPETALAGLFQSFEALPPFAPTDPDPDRKPNPDGA